MSDGVTLSGSGFVDRSRFRTNFENYEAEAGRKRTPKLKKVNDISAPSQKIEIKNKVNEATPKIAKLAIDTVSASQVVPLPIMPSYSYNPPMETSYKSARFGFLSDLHFKKPNIDVRNIRNASKSQLITAALAILIIIAGAYLSFVSWQNNQDVKQQATKLTQEANKASSTGSGNTNAPALSTIKPTPKAVAAYAVAPNNPKYLKIPAIGVDAEVGSVGLLSNGALGTPSNVFSTDWYNGSALPGQPGATLIDGHVSSWTSHGVFYNLHALKAGDAIQIVKGDNSVVNYQVVKTQVYSSGNVDMQAAITPVDPTVSGLNLITCTGQVIKGTSQFNQRVIVFAKEV